MTADLEGVQGLLPGPSATSANVRQKAGPWGDPPLRGTRQGTHERGGCGRKREKQRPRRRKVKRHEDCQATRLGSSEVTGHPSESFANSAINVLSLVKTQPGIRGKEKRPTIYYR